MGGASVTSDLRLKPIPGFDGRYLAGSDGCIYSTLRPGGYRRWGVHATTLRRNRPQKRKAQPRKDGYLHVSLRIGGRTVSGGVHRFVAMAFHGLPPFTGARARHKNGVRDDNRPSNLRWGTAAQNAADREAHGNTARGVLNGKTTLTPRVVQRIRRLALGGMALRAIASAVNVGYYAVRSVLSGHTWSHLPGPRPLKRSVDTRYRGCDRFSLYVLADPTTREYRYVGTTQRPLSVRLYRHVKALRADGADEATVDAWIRGLDARGLYPWIESLQTVRGRVPALSAEAWWIARLLSLGCALLNENKRGTTRSPMNNARLVAATPEQTVQLGALFSARYRKRGGRAKRSDIAPSWNGRSPLAWRRKRKESGR